jgi:amino acid transporter
MDLMSETASPLPADEDNVVMTASDLPELKHGALDLRHAIVISVAVMSPAASIFFNSVPQAGLVGAAIPLCYLIGFVLALLVANQYSEFSRELPSSGSAYTFVTEGIGSSWGLLTAWIGIMAVLVGVPYSFILMSANIQTLMQRWFGLNLHWSFWFVAAIGIVFAISYAGIRRSMSVDLTLLIFEMIICLILALIVLFRVGEQGGLTAAPFTLAAVPANGDLTAGIIFSVLSFIGFETAATLGEETRNPHRNIPRAVYGSMLVVGIFYVLMAYVATVGYGIDHMVNGYAQDTAPFDTIGRRFGGGPLTAFIDIVGILSFFSAAIAIINGGARIIFAVGRDGLLPRWLAWTHPVHHTPVGAILALSLVGLIAGIGLGIFLTPIDAFAFLGTFDAMLILLLYLLVNIACIRFFWRKRRAQFHWLRHGLVPALSLLMVVLILVAALASPGDAPLNAIPYVLAIWVALGLVVLFVARKRLLVSAE